MPSRHRVPVGIRCEPGFDEDAPGVHDGFSNCMAGDAGAVRDSLVMPVRRGRTSRQHPFVVPCLEVLALCQRM